MYALPDFGQLSLFHRHSLTRNYGDVSPYAELGAPTAAETQESLRCRLPADFAPGMTDAALQQPFANYLPVQAADAADTPCIVPGSVRSMATDDAGPVRRSKPMRCHACNIDFDGLAALRQHNTKQHDGVNTYLCPHCDSRFNSNSQLLTHITKKHGDAPILGPAAQQGVPAAKAGGPAKAAAAQDVASQHTESSVDPMETGSANASVQSTEASPSTFQAGLSTSKAGLSTSEAGPSTSEAGPSTSEAGPSTSGAGAADAPSTTPPFPRLKMRIALDLDNNKRPFCFVCMKVVERIRDHIRGEHSGPENARFKCALCSRNFPSYKVLRRHNLDDHRSQPALQSLQESTLEPEAPSEPEPELELEPSLEAEPQATAAVQPPPPLRRPPVRGLARRSFKRRFVARLHQQRVLGSDARTVGSTRGRLPSGRVLASRGLGRGRTVVINSRVSSPANAPTGRGQAPQDAVAVETTSFLPRALLTVFADQPATTSLVGGLRESRSIAPQAASASQSMASSTPSSEPPNQPSNSEPRPSSSSMNMPGSSNGSSQDDQATPSRKVAKGKRRGPKPPIKLRSKWCYACHTPMDNFNAHMYSIHTKGRMKCSECGKRFNAHKMLGAHWEKYHGYGHSREVNLPSRNAGRASAMRTEPGSVQMPVPAPVQPPSPSLLLQPARKRRGRPPRRASGDVLEGPPVLLHQGSSNSTPPSAALALNHAAEASEMSPPILSPQRSARSATRQRQSLIPNQLPTTTPQGAPPAPVQPSAATPQGPPPAPVPIQPPPTTPRGPLPAHVQPSVTITPREPAPAPVEPLATTPQRRPPAPVQLPATTPQGPPSALVQPPATTPQEPPSAPAQPPVGPGTSGNSNDTLSTASGSLASPSGSTATPRIEYYSGSTETVITAAHGVVSLGAIRNCSTQTRSPGVAVSVIVSNHAARTDGSPEAH